MHFGFIGLCFLGGMLQEEGAKDEKEKGTYSG